MVSDDPRCRLSLDDRVLGGLVRDTVARVHGTFGSAACSIGFAGARVGAGNRADGKMWRAQGSGEGPQYDIVLFRRLGPRALGLDESEIRRKANS